MSTITVQQQKSHCKRAETTKFENDSSNGNVSAPIVTANAKALETTTTNSEKYRTIYADANCANELRNIKTCLYGTYVSIVAIVVFIIIVFVVQILLIKLLYLSK